MARRPRRGVDTWGAIRSMIAPELERFRARYPRSRRRAVLEALAAAAEDTAALVEAGAEYFALTSAVPPRCYAERPAREPRYFLAGQRARGRRRDEAWSIHPYNYQVWR
jgi:hypothetical protein